MSNGVNKTILVGNLGRPPESGVSNAGKAYCKFSVATGKSWKAQDGTKQESTEWHNCVAFNKLAEICGQYLTQGQQVYIEGELRTSNWIDAETQKKMYKTEHVVNELRMLGSRQEAAAQPQHQASYQQAANQQPYNQQAAAQQSAQPVPSRTNGNGTQQSPYSPQQPQQAPAPFNDDDIPF